MGRSVEPARAGNATELKDKLIATERFTEPHFQRAAERYVQLALQVMHRVRPDHAPTLAGVVSILEPGRLSALTRRLPNRAPNTSVTTWPALTADQQSAIRGLASRLAIVTESQRGVPRSPPIPAASTCEARVGRRCGRSSASIRVPTASSPLSSGRSPYRTWSRPSGSRLAVPANGAGARRDRRVLGARLRQRHLAARRGRESGVSVLLATQELADLDRAARGLRDQVLGNTALKIAHRQEVPASAQALAQMAGTVRRWERSYQVRGGPFGMPDTSREHCERSMPT